MRRGRNSAQRLRAAVDMLPIHTREAMLLGIDETPIIAGAYVDGSGGVCPMLAAHRNGGRTSQLSFAKAWDRFTGANRARRATGREVSTLRAYLELSLLRDEQDEKTVAELADEVRADRRRFAEEAAWKSKERDPADDWARLLELARHAPLPPTDAPAPRRRSGTLARA